MQKDLKRVIREQHLTNSYFTSKLRCSAQSPEGNKAIMTYKVNLSYKVGHKDGRFGIDHGYFAPFHQQGSLQL